MSFTYDLATSIGQVRLNLSDTDAAAYAFEDAEITYLITTYGTTDAATGRALRILLTDRARRSKRFSLPGMSYDDTAALAEIRALVSMYGGDMPVVGVIMPAAIGSDRAFVDPYTSTS